MGKYSNWTGIPEVHNSIVLFSKIDPHGLLQIFLPILVFEAGFNLDWHIFRKELA